MRPRYVRRAIARSAIAAQRYFRLAARSILRFPSFRSILNVIEESAGLVVLYPRRDFRVSDLIDFVCHTPEIRDAFLWKSRVGPARFIVPVDPAFPDPNSSDPWGPSSYWRRQDNRQIRRFYEAFLRRRPSGVFLDVGANFGMHTYPFAASGYRSVSFEPLAACCDFIRRVSGLNGFTNVTVVENAVGAACRSGVPFFESNTAAFSSMHERHVATFNVPWQPRTVDCVTLDAYCRDHQLAPSFVKIDTEEFELEVLRGGAQVLQEFKPGLLVEVAADADNRNEIWERFASAGYRCYQILERSDARYRGQLVLPIRSASEFAAARPRDPSFEAEDFNTDFVFLQPRDDLFATNG